MRFISIVSTVIALLSVHSISIQSLAAAEDTMLLDGKISSPHDADTYTFRQGFPTGDTVKAAYRNSLMRRAIEAYKTFLPTIATEAVIQQMLNAGAVANKIGISMDQGPRQ